MFGHRKKKKLAIAHNGIISHLIEVSSGRSRVGECQLEHLLRVDDIDGAYRHGKSRRAHVVRVKHSQRSRNAAKQKPNVSITRWRMSHFEAKIKTSDMLTNSYSHTLN